MDPPDSLPYEVTFRYFADWFRQSQPGAAPEVLDAAWEKYKRDGLRKMQIVAFDEHKRKMWFREKYEGGEGVGGDEECAEEQGEGGQDGQVA